MSNSDFWVLLVNSRSEDDPYYFTRDGFRGIFSSEEDAEKAAKEHGYKGGEYRIIYLCEEGYINPSEVFNL